MAIGDFTGNIPLFFNEFLGKPASALPKGAQWVIDLEGLQDVRSAIIETSKLEPGQGWDIEAGLRTLIGYDYSQGGCLFAQAVSVPGESTIANPEGIQFNHYIRTAVGAGRGDFAPTGLQVVFLDTNVSFVDNVVRPWVVTTGRLGLIARTGRNNYRQNISVYKLGVLTPDQPPFILQKYTFFGCCPISVSSEEYNYSPATTPINRETTFIFHHYSLETGDRENLAIRFNNANIPISTPPPPLYAGRESGI